MKTVPNYCRSFRDEAWNVWNTMSKADRLGVDRNEETITEDLLLSLADKHHGRGLTIKSFSKTVESINGADWAFWFSNHPYTGIGVRIQAKRIYAKTGKYDALFHQSDAQKKESRKNGTYTPNQCEALLSYRDGLVPIYAFYNSDKLDLHQASHWPSAKHWLGGCCSIPHSEDWGIAAASALAVKRANWGKKNRPGDFPILPWHCLVCPCCWFDRPVDQSLPSLIGHGLKQLYGLESLSKEDEFLGISFEPTDNVPPWVRQLRADDEDDGALRSTMNEMNLKGVAEIREGDLDD